jgi:hypothetical protein
MFWNRLALLEGLPQTILFMGITMKGLPFFAILDWLIANIAQAVVTVSSIDSNYRIRRCHALLLNTGSFRKGNALEYFYIGSLAIESVMNQINPRTKKRLRGSGRNPLPLFQWSDQAACCTS